MPHDVIANNKTNVHLSFDIIYMQEETGRKRHNSMKLNARGVSENRTCDT